MSPKLLRGELHYSLLEEWLQTYDGKRAFRAWGDTLPERSFTRKEFEQWVSACPEFRAYIDQRVGGIVADLKRQGRAYERDGRIYFPKHEREHEE